MALLEDLLSQGYFPKELPPCFSTSSFASRTLANRRTWPAAAGLPVSKMCTYSLAKAGGLRRKLSLPNPICHLQLCEFLSSQGLNVRAHTRASAFSLSKPVRDRRRTRALVPGLSLEQLPTAGAIKRANARCVVTTDLSEFYPSLYTHSIPWAIHGKAAAKAQRGGAALYGNKLDQLLRSAQDQQTVGIPIGPDTSLVVAEILLSAVDQQLACRIPNLRGLRYMDDFEFYFADPSAAEKSLAILHETLLEFELRLNPHKTAIEQAPLGIEPEWVHVFRNFAISPTPMPQSKDLIRYFDILTKYLREYPTEHVVKYALARLMTLTVHPRNWDLYQSLLAGALTVEPGAINTYINILVSSFKKGLQPLAQLTEAVLNATIERSAPLGHHHEVAWCLWAALSFGFSINRAAAEGISRLDNSVVALLALDAEQRGLVLAGLDKGRWESRMTTADLYEDQWLLAYEANIKGWLPGDHIVSDQAFAFLKGVGVEFYNPVPVLEPARAASVPLVPAVVAGALAGY